MDDRLVSVVDDMDDGSGYRCKECDSGCGAGEVL